MKRLFGDESGVQVTDDDIVRWANDAQRDITMENEDILQKSTVTDAVEGQQNYSLPTDIMVLRSVSYKHATSTSYLHLRGMTLQEFDELVDGWDGPLYGNGWPQIYHVYENTLKVWPLPASSIVAGFKIYYSRRPVDLVNDVDQIDLPIPYHNAVVNYCLAKAYELDEDLQSATYKDAQVQNAIVKNKDRENWVNREYYPTITVQADDVW